MGWGWLATAPRLFAQSGAPSTPDFDWLGALAGTGIVGVILCMVIMRWKLMPTYVYDEAKAAWDEERARYESDAAEYKSALAAAHDVYIREVVPTLTRALDAQRELLELRRDEAAERRVRGGS